MHNVYIIHIYLTVTVCAREHPHCDNPIQSNVNKRAQVFLFARIFYTITFTYKLKYLRFQLTRNENCKEHLD